MSQMAPEQRRSGEVERRSPFADLDDLGNRMRRMLQQTFGDFTAAPADAVGWMPNVDLEEQENAYVVEAELPGVKREDVDIELAGNELSITGEVKEKEREGMMRRRMRRVGRFQYRVMLPDQIDPESIEANLSDGVLMVRVPKAQQADRRKIEVKSS
jgi:HSP20 family protein